MSNFENEVLNYDSDTQSSASFDFLNDYPPSPPVVPPVSPQVKIAPEDVQLQPEAKFAAQAVSQRVDANLREILKQVKSVKDQIPSETFTEILSRISQASVAADSFYEHAANYLNFN